ncbi:MAG: hypothetical protein ACK5MK_12575 [Dysgonomonas sp.]
MNYIELINRFWRLNKELSFTSYETQLYFKLLDTCNSLGWKNPFNQSNRFICGELGLSERKLLDVRNRLKQCGLIEYESGKSKKKSGIYSIVFHPNDHSNGYPNDHHIEGNCSDNTKNKSNKTKPKREAFTPPTQAQVKEFFIEKKQMSEDQSGMLSQYFIDFYESKNWMVGRNKMTNWEAAAARAVHWLDDGKDVKVARKTLSVSKTLHDNAKSYEKF